jgi:hypothetical protein
VKWVLRSERSRGERSGPFTVHPDGRTEFHPIVLPDTKNEIEDAILKAALNGKLLDLRTFYGLKSDPVRNPEDHFDFTLDTMAGVKYLDLMEVAPLKGSGGSYEKVGNIIKLAEQMDAVYAEIKKRRQSTDPIRAHLFISFSTLPTSGSTYS